ncbi:MAG: cyanophycin synthetase [Eubacterium sp.]
MENALCALEALKILKREYPRLTKNNIRDGLLKTYWPGRFEKIGENPDFYLDGAHNEDAVKKLRKTLDSTFTDRKIVYIMGVLADKDFQNMIETMFRPGDLVYTVTPDNPRALPGKNWQSNCGRNRSLHFSAKMEKMRWIVHCGRQNRRT